MSFSSRPRLVLVLVRGLFLICILMLVVAVLVNGGVIFNGGDSPVDSPGLGWTLYSLFMAACCVPFTYLFFLSALNLVRVGSEIVAEAMLTYSALLSRWRVKIDAAPDRWRHTENSDDGQISHRYHHAKATDAVSSSVDVEQPTPKQPTKNFEATLGDITVSTTDEEQEDEDTLLTVDDATFEAMIPRNQPYVAMASAEANVGCVRFYLDMLDQIVCSVFSLLLSLLLVVVLGYAGIGAPFSLILDPDGSISAPWLMVPYFGMTVSGPIWYILADADSWRRRDEARIQERVTAGSIHEMVTAERHQDQQTSGPRVIVMD
jgi:hypothetical protein